MNDHDPIEPVTTRLRQLAAETPEPNFDHLEKQLLRAFAQHQQSNQPATRNLAARWWQWAAAAVLVLGVIGFSNVMGRLGSGSAPLESNAGDLLAAYLSEFVALPGAAALPDFESGRIVRIQVPVGALPTYGFNVIPDSTRSSVEADILIGQDGLARAIRLGSSDLNP